MDVTEILTNESVLCFTDGQTIKGANEVGAAIRNCCEKYAHGYFQGTVVGLVVGTAIACVAIYTTRYVVRKVKKYSKLDKESKTEA